jgi:uncharacterized protein YhaN
MAAWRARPAGAGPTGRPSAAIEAELRALPAPPAGDLRADATVVAAVRELELAEEARRALESAAAAPSTPRRPLAVPVVVGAALGVAAIVAFAAGAPLLAAILALAALGSAIWGAHRARRSLTPSDAAHAKPDVHERVAAARAGLVAALQARGVEPTGDPVADAAAYETACRARADVAARAASAAGLQRELDAARNSELLLAEQARAIADAESSLAAAARAVGLEIDPGVPPDEIVAALESWRTRHAAETDAAEQAIREYQELIGLLEGRTVSDLADDAARLERSASALARAAGPVEETSDLADEAAAAAEVERQRELAASLAGALEVRERELVDVAAAEEAAAAARRRLDQIVELAGIVDETLGLLEAAQRQVHRDLAPILAAAIRHWLPILSDGAYDDAGVNPADLSIEVKERATGAWRQARLLSGGTREQIYLLLRVAMAQHLVTTAESAPMLLDEVTAQADAGRRRAVLDMLLALAAERQLILFTHDDAVLAWAESQLVGEPHRIIRLPLAPRVPPSAEPTAIPVGSGT